MKIPLFILIVSSFLLSCTDQSNPNIKAGTTQVVGNSSGIVIQMDQSGVTQILKDAYSEEKLAEAIYTKMFEKYPTLSEVANIVQSEERHSEQVGRLLDARNITRPSDYGVYTEAYTVLSKLVDSSLTGATEAGVIIEVGDIDHLLEEYKKVDNTDIRIVFESIGGGSFNHLRAFLRVAQANSYTVKTDYTRYIKPVDLETRGPLQGKMTELLTSNGLPVFGAAENKGNGRGHGGMMNR